MSTSRDEIRKVVAHAERLFSPEDVDVAVDRMAAEMNAALAEKDPLLLCVMTGGVVPTGLLLPRLRFPLELDYLHVSRYQGQTSGGEIEWLRRPHCLLSGRVVVVVDDVLDEGLTLSAILKACKRDGAAEALTAVLVAKRLQRCAGMPSPNFVGLETDERYLFGYGMDYKNYLRNAPGIFAVST